MSSSESLSTSFLTASTFLLFVLVSFFAFFEPGLSVFLLRRVSRIKSIRSSSESLDRRFSSRSSACSTSIRRRPARGFPAASGSSDAGREPRRRTGVRPAPTYRSKADRGAGSLLPPVCARCSEGANSHPSRGAW